MLKFCKSFHSLIVNNTRLILNPWGGGPVGTSPPPLVSCPLLKIYLGNPYLKILDLAKLFVADAPMKKKSRNLVLPPSQSTLKCGSQNRPWVRVLKQVCLKNTYLKKLHVG